LDVFLEEESGRAADKARSAGKGEQEEAELAKFLGHMLAHDDESTMS
jgi:hypothetical protein